MPHEVPVLDPSFPVPLTREALSRWVRRDRLLSWSGLLHGMSMPVGFRVYEPDLELPSQVLFREFTSAMCSGLTRERLQAVLDDGNSALEELRAFESRSLGRLEARRLRGLLLGSVSMMTGLLVVGYVAATFGEGRALLATGLLAGVVVASVLLNCVLQDRLDALSPDGRRGGPGGRFRLS